MAISSQFWVNRSAHLLGLCSLDCGLCPGQSFGAAPESDVWLPEPHSPQWDERPGLWLWAAPPPGSPPLGPLSASGDTKNSNYKELYNQSAFISEQYLNPRDFRILCMRAWCISRFTGSLTLLICTRRSLISVSSAVILSVLARRCTTALSRSWCTCSPSDIRLRQVSWWRDLKCQSNALFLGLISFSDAIFLIVSNPGLELFLGRSGRHYSTIGSR